MTDDDAINSGYDPAVADVLLAMWTEAFGQPGISVDDDFFALGGYSVLAAQLCARIRETFSVDLPLTSFLVTPTIAELARKISDSAAAGQISLDRIEPQRRGLSLADLLAEIESLSDDEVAAAMRELDSEI